MIPDLDVDWFSGPGGWCEGARSLGLRLVGFEWDAAACATRAAAGHLTVRADIARFPVAQFAGRVRGFTASPPCKQFSAAGKRGGVGALDILAALIGDMMAGRKTMAARRREMAAALAAAWWPDPRLPKAVRMAKTWAAVREASLVAEPARFIAACHPEWVALEQVPAVLPLWRVYAAELAKRGYSAWCGKLNAADYGVPQTRERAILIASRIRRVSRPVPTHYDPRKGDQLWGEPWVSMAEALGWGASARPGPAVTAGGTATGGAEPFGHRDRDMLAGEQEAGRWALRTSFGTPSGERTGTHEMDPWASAAHTVTGKAKDWVLRRSRGEGMLDREGRGGRRDHPADEPAPTITGAGGKPAANLSWVLRTGNNSELGGGALKRYERGIDEPAPTFAAGDGSKWTLHTNRSQEPDGTRQTIDPSTAPALTAKSGAQWVVKSFRNNNNNNACARSPDEPAGTLFFGGRSNWAAWVVERPATTVQGDPRVGRPGHKDRDKGEAQFAQDSVRITIEEAAILQSFPPGYPWQGTKTAQFTQVGNAFPPRLAAHVLAMATGISLADLAA